MDDNINVLHGVIKGVGGGKVSSDGHGEQVSVLFARGLHLIGLGLRPCCPGNFDPAFKEGVDDVGTHVSCGTCDKNMARRRLVKTCRTWV